MISKYVFRRTKVKIQKTVVRHTKTYVFTRHVDVTSDRRGYIKQMGEKNKNKNFWKADTEEQILLYKEPCITAYIKAQKLSQLSCEENE